MGPVEMAAIQQGVRWGVLRKPKRMQPESDQTLMSRQPFGGDSGVGFTTESHDKNMTERLLCRHLLAAGHGLC